MKSKFLFLFIGFTLLSKINFAQIGFAALSNTEQYRYEKGLYSLSNESHTSFKPYLIKDLKTISFFGENDGLRWRTILFFLFLIDNSIG